MKIFAIDTAAGLCSLSLWEGSVFLGKNERQIPRGHAALLAPLCQALLTKHGLKISDLDRLLVNIGPGSFTGIRVGVSFAKGLSQAANIPLEGITAFDAALCAHTAEKGTVLVVLDARRKDYYCQLTHLGIKETPCALLPDAIARILTTHRPMLIGNGAPTLIKGLGLNDTLPEPQYFGACALVQAYLKDHSQTPIPFYLRQADVNLKAC